MADMEPFGDETSFWYLKAHQRRVTEIELQVLTRTSVDAIDEITREMQTNEHHRIPVIHTTTKEEGK